MRVLTEKVSWSTFQAKQLLVLKSISQPHKKAGATLEAINWILLGHLQATSHHLHVQFSEATAVNLASLRGVGAEHASLEHLQAGDSEALTPSVDPPGLLALVLPLCSCASVEENGYDEQVDQAASTLLHIDRRRPRRHELVDSRSTADVKVLPSAVRRNACVVRRIVTLLAVSVSGEGAERDTRMGRKLLGTHLDDRDDVGSRVLELCHIDGEMLQLILLCLFKHQLRSLADGMYAAEITNGVESRIWGLWNGDIWKRALSTSVCRTRHSWGFERTIGLIGVCAGDDGRLAALPAEETHVWRGQQAEEGGSCWDSGGRKLGGGKISFLAVNCSSGAGRKQQDGTVEERERERAKEEERESEMR